MNKQEFREMKKKATLLTGEDFHHWLTSLKPDDLARVELYLRRCDLSDKADVVEQAGLANCGEEYHQV